MDVASMSTQLPMVLIIVLRPDPVQDPGSRFWSGHRVGRVSFFFLNQNDVILIKKTKKNKSQRVCNQVLTGSSGQLARSARSHRVFPSSIFSSTRPSSSPGSAGSWIDPPGRVSKLWFLRGESKSADGLIVVSINPLGWMRVI